MKQFIEILILFNISYVFFIQQILNMTMQDIEYFERLKNIFISLIEGGFNIRYIL